MLMLSGLLFVSSCGNDEPDWLIGYYMSIDSQVKLSLTEEDNSQGTSPAQAVDVLSNTIRKMRTAMQDAYPKDTRKGDDAAVLTALGDIYRDYKESYADKERHTVCVVKLFRVKKSGVEVKDSSPLASYHFGALPEDTTALGQ